jgi:hypothetical protein
MRNALCVFAIVASSIQPTHANSTSSPSGFGASRRFESNITVSLASLDVGFAGRIDGISAEAQVFVPRIFFLKVGTHEYDGIESNAFGFGFAIGAGNGRVTLGLDLASVEEELQTKLSVAYEHRFASGLFIGGGLTGFINDNSLPQGYACGVLSGGWKFENGLSVVLSAATADHILGLGEDEPVFSLGIRHTY